MNKSSFPDYSNDDEFVEEALFTFSKCGRTKLIKDDFKFYKRDVLRDGSIAWRCEKYKNKCKASAVTNSFGEIQRVKFFGEHQHLPNQ